MPPRDSRMLRQCGTKYRLGKQEGAARPARLPAPAAIRLRTASSLVTTA